MSWFWTIIFLNLAFGNYYNCSEAMHPKKLPSAVIVGTVYCDTCFKKELPKAKHFIEGASVAVECHDPDSRRIFRQEAKTDNLGEFKVHLPFYISKHVKKIKNCSVKLISSSSPYCAVSATATSNTISHLKSRKEGAHVFSAGFFRFKPLNQPLVCDQKPSIKNFKKFDSSGDQKSAISNPNDPTFLPPIQDPPSDNPPALGYLPPLPLLPKLPPLPSLPRLPPLFGIPFLPPVLPKESETKPSQLSEGKVTQPVSFPFPPNPFNPPSIFPPNPFQPPPSVIPPVFPSPPSSIFPPLFPSPPPSIFPPLFPSIPSLIRSPPPPPVFSFPPFPFQPVPGFPGVPPAKVSSQPKASSP